MKCAITGVNGYLGKCLKAYFKNHGWNVFPLTHLKEDRTDGEGIFYELNDGVEPEILSGVDVLLHCSYDFSVKRWEDIISVNVTGSMKLFSTARAAGIRTIIYISSMSAFPNCRSMYGRAKLMIEGEAQRAGAVIVRPGLIYDAQAEGMFGAIVKAVRQLPFVVLIGQGDQVQYLIHCDDLCRFIFMLANKKEGGLQRPITVAFEKGYSIKDITRIIAQAYQRRVLTVHIPIGLAYGCLKAAEIMGMKKRLRPDSLIGLIHYDRYPSFSQMHELDFHPREFSMSSLINQQKECGP